MPYCVASCLPDFILHVSMLILKNASGMFLQAEEADGASFAQPLRRYANMVADDMRMSHRGTLGGNGKLKAGAAVTSQPQVHCCADSSMLIVIVMQV